MKEISFQNIYNILQEVITIDWKKIVFYAEYSEGSYSMKFYVKNMSGKYIDCFSLEGVTDMEVIKIFKQVNKEIQPVRECETNNIWNLLTMIITDDGDFKAHYEYENVNYMIDHKEKWMQKYLV